MQSTTVLAFRIFVMLSCLILVPMAAIFGSAFPEVVKGLLVDRLVEWSTGKSAEAAHEDGAAGFGTVAPAHQGAATTGDTSNSEAPRWGQQPGGSAYQPPPASPMVEGVIPAGATNMDTAPGAQPAAYVAAPEPSAAPWPTVDPAAAQAAPAPTRQPFSYASGPATVPQGVAQPAEQPDRFTAMERRLREYGATYYLLETWGNDGELYRFHCKMAVGSDPNHTRHFEATDRDALQAMSQVLERVESWRAGRPH